MSFAIIETGGKQFRVTEGEVIALPSLSHKVGDTVELSVLAHGDGEGVQIGTPVLDGVTASATILEHGRSRKIIVFKKKKRKQYKRTHGHRQGFTRVRIDSIGSAS
ncbi:MAG TPA: 50S ribosomal protein L21 [Blastocatellia bacterium]|nr:50S ribosomal protein L21 [Blastocatellia bacterium]